MDKAKACPDGSVLVFLRVYHMEDAWNAGHGAGALSACYALERCDADKAAWSQLAVWA